MKIADLRIDLVERHVPPIPVVDDRGSLGGTVQHGILRITTEEGLEGNATVGPFGEGLEPLLDQILSIIKPQILGCHVAEREWLWHRLDRMAGHWLPLHFAWSNVDVALWDIQGKASGVPVHHLLGTARTEVAAYASTPPRHASPEGFAEEAVELRDRGFAAYKFHPGALRAREAVRTAAAVRDAVGDDMDLMLDANNSYDLRTALVVGRVLDDCRFLWFEDPVPGTDFEAITELTARLSTPVAIGDEAHVMLREAAHYVRLGAPQIIRGSSRKLGITGLKKLCSLLEGFGRNCEIGIAGTSLMNAANLHVIMSTSNCSFYEVWLPERAHQFGVTEDIRVTSDGTVHAPTGPGLGLALDEEWVAAHRIATLA